MLEVKGLSKSYANVPALSTITFELGRGEVVALLGANGSGKTTTIQSICRLINWEQGDILINGESTQKSLHFQQHIGAVLGGCRNTNWRLTAKQNADYFARLHGFSGSQVKARIKYLHTQLGLDEHESKQVMKLSTGNKQKAALLCALSYAPQLVLLDEPTLGLDFTTVSELQRIIQQQAKEQQQSFLITSHDLGFIDKICSRVIVLDHGELLFQGSLKALKDKLMAYELILVLDKDDNTPMESSSHYKQMQKLWVGRYSQQTSDNQWCIQYESPKQSLPMLNYLHQQGVSPNQLTISTLSAERAYQTLVQQRASL